MNKGFTLIELSIVLVIIGLLVSGILVAQSLIDSANLQSQVRQFQQLDAAVASFKSRYKAIPGDAAIAYPRFVWGAASVQASRDGIITDDNRSSDTYHMRASGVGESALFALELAILTNFTPDNCSDIGSRIPGTDPEGPRVNGENCNAIQAIYGENIAILPYAYDLDGNMPYPSNTDGNAYYLLNCTAVTNQRVDGGNCIEGYTQLQALSLDAKMDDGINNSGDIEAGTKTGGGFIRSGLINKSTPYDTDSSTPLVVIRKFGEY